MTSLASSFVCLLACLQLAMSFCLIHTDYLVKLAQRSNVFAPGVARCIIVYTLLSLKQLIFLHGLICPRSLIGSPEVFDSAGNCIYNSDIRNQSQS